MLRKVRHKQNLLFVRILQSFFEYYKKKHPVVVETKYISRRIRRINLKKNVAILVKNVSKIFKNSDAKHQREKIVIHCGPIYEFNNVVLLTYIHLLKIHLQVTG